MDSIVSKGMTVRELKRSLVKEAYEQGIEIPFEVDRYVSQGIDCSSCYHVLCLEQNETTQEDMALSWHCVLRPPSL